MTGFRKPCSSGCGRLVDPANSKTKTKQCRKCRRKLALVIRRRAAKIERSKRNEKARSNGSAIE
jgi:hypothetical protein